MSWESDVLAFIDKNLEDYTRHFFDGSIKQSGKYIFVNPCPFCTHKDCFGFTKGKAVGHCFSCDMAGNHIQLVKEHHGEAKGIQLLAEWSGIPYVPSERDKQKIEEKEKSHRLQAIYRHAVHFYHERLKTVGEITDSAGVTRRPKDAQVGNPESFDYSRRHTVNGIVAYNVGYSGGYKELYQQLVDKGHTEEDLKEAAKMIRIPDGYFVYPYYDVNGNLLRFNCRAFIRTCRGKKKAGGGYHYDCNEKFFKLEDYLKESHERDHDHEYNPPRLSRGSKEMAFQFPPKGIKSKKRGILIEGENDNISMYEGLLLLEQAYPKYTKDLVPIGVGGNSGKGMFDSDFLRSFDELFEAFDNDEAGDKYRKQLDEELPDVIVRKLNIPLDYKDPDEMLKMPGPDIDPIELLKGLLDDAEIKKTDHYRIWRDLEAKRQGLHKWYLKNRMYMLEYEVEGLVPRHKKYIGTATAYKHDGSLIDRQVGDINERIKFKAGIDTFRIFLGEAVDQYYQIFRWKDSRPIRPYAELLEIYRFARNRDELRKQIAWYVHQSEKPLEDEVKYIKNKVKDQTEVDYILKEVNGIENEELNPEATYPKMRLAQAFFPHDGNGYLYFAKQLVEEGALKRVPCLISNRKEEIRLDLLKRKDPQSMLLVNNKYQLAREIELDYTDGNPISLHYKYLNDWLRGEMTEDQYAPTTIIAEIEAFIHRTYILSDDAIKVISLWIFATYFYTLFTSGFPYLLFNGEKGSGKTVMDKILNLLSFNPSFMVHTSEAALFRSISLYGGTFILDEMEYLKDKKKVDESGIATILKAGYAESGAIFRIDPDTGLPVQWLCFGPKVISNINGLDDVIMDRCIEIKTYKVSEAEVSKLENIDSFYAERREEINNLTSRAAICALMHFQDVYEILQTDTRIDTGNLRLTQILVPLITLARFVGGSYEDAIMRFYESDIKGTKAEIKGSTLNGKIEKILYDAAAETLGLVPDDECWVLKQQRDYKAVAYDKANETFTVDVVQLKLMVEELDPDNSYPWEEVQKAVRIYMGKKFNGPTMHCKRTRLTITDEEMRKRFKGMKVLQANRYTFSCRDFISKQLEVLTYGPKVDSGELF